MKLSHYLLLLSIFFIIFFSIMDVESFSRYRLYRYDGYFHIMMYAIFSFLSMLIAYQKRYKLLMWILLIFPFLTESLQYFIPARTADVRDLLYNYYGLVFGIILFIIFNYVKKNKHIKSCNS